MKLSIAILNTLAAAALAAPSPNAVSRSLARRSAHKSIKQSNAAKTQDTSIQEVYNENWAGAVIDDLASGETFSAVSATFDVLTPKVPTDFTTDLKEYTASAWIGIDGDNCAGGLWQAGVDSIVQSSGETSFYAWYEWFPADTVVIDLGTISAGDVINVNISAASATTGTVVLENQTTGKSFTKTVTSSDKLCLGSAEWIMEDVTFEDSTTGLADFGSAVFTNAVAVTSKGTVTAAESNIIMDVEDNKSEKLTKSSVSGSTVTVSYV